MADVVAPRCETIRSLNNGFSNGFGDSLEHSLENPLVKRIEDVPVEEPGEPLWDVSRELLKLGSAVVHRVKPEFKGGFTREFHLRQEMQVIGFFHLEDSKEIHSIPCPELKRVSSSSAQACSAHQSVHSSPNDPKRIR